MKQNEINEFVTKLRNDPKLMDSFLDDPVNVFKKSGYSLTPEQETKLKSLNKEALKSKIQPSGKVGVTEGCGYHLC